MKVGDEYYEAYADQYEGTVEMDLWIITALRGGVVHACRKNQFTWVKRSKTNGDYGWARTLGQHDRKSFPESSPPAEWARTKAAAYSKTLPEVEAAIKRLTKLRATMTGQRTRARPKPKTPKVRAALSSSPSQGGETLKADFARAFPGGKLDDSAYEDIEGALVEACKPFAKVADEYDDRENDGHEVWKDVSEPVMQRSSRLGNYRRLREALAAFQSRKEESL